MGAEGSREVHDKQRSAETQDATCLSTTTMLVSYTEQGVHEAIGLA